MTLNLLVTDKTCTNTLIPRALWNLHFCCAIQWSQDSRTKQVPNSKGGLDSILHRKWTISA